MSFELLGVRRRFCQPQLLCIDEVLQQTIYALFAAHPELVSSDSLEACHHATAESWMADAIYDEATALQHLLERTVRDTKPPPESS